MPLGQPFDSTIESDASDTGVGAVTFVDGAGAAASTLVAALLALAPAAISRRMIVRHARSGLEFMAALPAHLLAASSTLRELNGIDLAISALAHLLRGGRHMVVMDNLGCVFIMGGVVPSFATGGRAYGASSYPVARPIPSCSAWPSTCSISRSSTNLPSPSSGSRAT